jgi:hypothetical protein
VAAAAAAAKAASPSGDAVAASMPRLLSKLYWANCRLHDDAPIERLPEQLKTIGLVLNQFDQTLFHIIWLSTNFALLTRSVSFLRVACCLSAPPLQSFPRG